MSLGYTACMMSMHDATSVKNRVNSLQVLKFIRIMHA